MATGSTGVYGGIDYNTADAAAKKRLVDSRLKLSTDAGYKQSETARALQAIKDREASGLDTSAQQKYLTNQLGYKAPSAAPTAVAPVTPAVTPPKTNISQSSELTDLMKAYATKQATPFSYDEKSDPAYQAALTRAQANINDGNAQVQAENNRRGILNSTITTDRGSEIAAEQMGNVETTIVPQLMSQAYQRYADQQNQEQQQFANQGSLAQMYTAEDQRGIDNTNTTAGLTGNLPGGEQAQSLYSQLLTLKQQAESPGVTAAERTKLSNQADGIRAVLSTMGVDTSKLGAGTNYSAASQVTPTIRTLQGQALDSSNKQADQAQEQQQWQNRFNYGQAIGKFANGQQTLDAKNLDFNQGLATRQQNTSEQQYTEQFAYQKARDSMADSQWKTKFDEDVRQNGLSYGLQQLAQTNDAAYQKANLAISQDENSRAWLDYGAGGTTAAKYDGLTVSQAIDSLRQAFTVTDPKTDAKSIPTDAATKEKIYQQAMALGLPDGQDSQAMVSLGLTPTEIAAFDKKYGVSGN